MTATVGPRRCTAAVYIRVSTEDQARRGYSLADQRAACLARAVALGARHVEVFADGGVSGSLLERPGLNALRAGLREGRFGLVVCLEPDRLARNLAHQLLLTEEIERAGARLEFVGFEWQRTPEGELFFALRGAIAQYEREKIRERTSRGRRQKARQGRMPAAFEPYGYRYDPSSSTLTPVEAEAAIVRAAFRWVVEEGLGPSAVARRLDALGVPTRRGAPGWHRGVVARLLRNPVYAGTFYANRYDAAGAFLNRHRAPWERRPVRLRPVEEWIPVPVPAIVEPAVWQAAQARLDVIGRRPTSRSTYLLSGLSVCAVCRRRLVGSVRHDWGRAHRYYTCRRRGPGAGGCRPPRYVPAGPLEEAVWRAVSQALMDLLRDVPTEARPAGPGRSTAEPAGGAAGSTAGVATDRVCPDRRRLLRRTILAALEAGLLSPEEALAELAHVAPEEGGAGAGASTAAGGPAAVPSAVPSAAADPLDEGETVRTDTAATHVGTAAVAFFGEADTGLRRRVLALVVRSVVVGEEVVVEAVLPSPAAGDARTPSLRTRC